jgi:dTDP-4-dehydrorhamnose reductase
MKILLIGGNGQLGQAISNKLDKKFDLKISTNSKNDQNYCDISNKKSIINIFEKFLPEVVINAAAFTDVDRCEIYRSKANQVNNLSLEEIASQCLKKNSILIHFSTDYVYDGNTKFFNSETDITNPINYYGTTKLNGEKKIIRSNCKFIILRLSWVYSSYKKNNFVLKIIEKLKRKDNITITNNEIGSITSTDFIAKKIEKILFFLKDKNVSIKEIFNLCPSLPSNRVEIVNTLINRLIKDNKKNHLMKGKAYNSKNVNNPYLAKRPINSKMNTSKFSSYFNEQIESWEEDLENFIITNNINV